MNLEFDGKIMKKRIRKRAEYLAITVTLLMILLLLIITFLSTNNVIIFNVTTAFILQGILLSIIIGAIVGFSYYVISGWMFLSE
jgi:hypothetical protein